MYPAAPGWIGDIMRVIITGGGTGGHIYPALAIAKGILEQWPEAEILYLGTAQGLEADIVPKSGINFQEITVQGFARPYSWRTVLSALMAIRGVFQAYAWVRRFKPDLVVGTGGYVCGPVVLASFFRGVPTVIHEQNAMPGVTNRILARFADAICVTFAEAIPYFSNREKIHLTGLPVRAEIIQAQRGPALAALGLAADKTTVVITGGSRGARKINQAVVAALPSFMHRSDLQFYHIAGPKEFADTVSALREIGIDPERPENYHIVPYLYQMENALAAADLIIGRAGASFLAEAMLRGLPAILIPYPFAAADHQTYNARAIEGHGAALVITDQELNGEKLTSVLQTLTDDPDQRLRMARAAKILGRENALNEILQVIASISRNG